MANRHIVCFGNELHGDDGFGPGVYARLQTEALPNDVELFNAGIAGLDALKFMEGCRQAILVDALANFGSAGEVLILRPDELAARPQTAIGHGLGVPYLLEAFNALRAPLPELFIVGVEVAEIKPFSLGLSPKTEQAIPQAVQIIRRLVSE